MVLNTALYFVLYRVGVWGVPLAISLANIAGVVLLFVALRRRVGRIDLSETTRSFLLVCLASAALALVALGVWWVLDEALGRSFLAQLVSLGAALSAGGGVYLVACRALGVPEIATLLSLRDRFRRD
jgi:putative peptidoglycan lipid II flippase